MSWIKIPKKSIHIIMIRRKAIMLINEWKKVEAGEMPIEKSIYLKSFMEKIERKLVGKKR